MVTTSRRTLIVAAGFISCLFPLLGCQQPDPWVQGIHFSASPDRKSFHVSIDFTKNVKTRLSASLPVKDFGNVFVKSASGSAPAEAGFDLQAKVMDDPQVVKLDLTKKLPNGEPLALGDQVVVLPPGTSDIHAYIDVLRRSWLGLAAFSGSDMSECPQKDHVVTEVFYRDKNGQPTVFSKIYCPERVQGITVFANVRAMFGEKKGIE